MFGKEDTMSLKATYIVPHPPLILPEIGKGSERSIKKTIESYHAVAKEIALIKPQTIIIISPHALAYSDCFSISSSPRYKGSFHRFGVNSVGFEVKNDLALSDAIIKNAIIKKIDVFSFPSKLDELDHGVMVPLYFLKQYYFDFDLVVIPLSGLSIESHYQLGQAIQETIQQQSKQIVIIASGDLSHKLTLDGPYGFCQEGPIYDQMMTDAMAKGDFFQFLTIDESLYSKAADCGRKSFVMMAGALDCYTVSPKLFSYEGPFGVGYAVASYHPSNQDSSRCLLPNYHAWQDKLMNQSRLNEDPYVALARKSLEYYLENKKALPLPQNLPQDLTNEKAGVFVSLKIDHELRGCIGTISPTTSSIALEIIQNAVSAGINDPRFVPVELSELKKIVYSVDVLGEATLVHDIIESDPKIYGVIVKYNQKTGLLLPNLEGVDTVEEQLSIALKKANIRHSDPYSIYRFLVTRHY